MCSLYGFSFLFTIRFFFSCDTEAKFILLWDKLLELSIKLVYEQEYQVNAFVIIIIITDNLINTLFKHILMPKTNLM